MSLPFLILFGILICLAVIGTLFVLRRVADRKRMESLVFFQVLMPRKESKEDRERESEKFSTGQDFREVLGVMDHLYQSLHALFNSRLNRFWKGQPFFAVEYAALAQEILFFVICPRNIAVLIEKQITSFYPDAVIDEVEDYNIFTEKSVVVAKTILPTKRFTTCFKTYLQLKSDPLNTITNSFSKLQADEGASIQIVLTPAKSGWQQYLQKEALRIINPKKKQWNFWNPLSWISSIFDSLVYGTENSKLLSEDKPTNERVSQAAEEYSKCLDEKASAPGFHTIIRIIASGTSAPRAQSIIDTHVASFGQF